MNGEAEPTVIAASGDLILNVRQRIDSEVFSYRVESRSLCDVSRYFDILLGERFEEGARVKAVHESLRAKYTEVGFAPAGELPRVDITDIGSISRVKSIHNITADFLRTLHGIDLAIPNPPVPNIANLAIVADRFDALPFFANHVKRKKYLHIIEAKSRGKTSSALTEERMRQKLLCGILLDYPPWVIRYSKRMIINGSVRWREQSKQEDAQWWDLPKGVEGRTVARSYGTRWTLTAFR